MTAPILILGARGGIGESLARRLAAAGQNLVLTGRTRDGVAPLAEALGASCAACDVLDEASIRAAVAAAAEPGGGLAGLAYCVGSILVKPLRTTTTADFIEHYRLNTVGAALAVKAAREALQQANGSVVLFSSIAVAQGFPNHAAIAAAKGGLEALSRALAAELAPRVRVNAIALSLTRTGMAAAFTENESLARGIAGLHPVGRLGLPEDAAALAAFLLGPDAGWLTGQVIGLDGGRSTLRPKG